jgi:hypothetical protein
MDILFTAGLIATIVAALVALGRTWPRSSGLGGYRAGRGAGHGESGTAPGTDAHPDQEDDDVRWDWRDR